MVKIKDETHFVPASGTPLPIFQRELEDGGRAFYAPGYLVVVDKAHAFQPDLNQPAPAFAHLHTHAHKALIQWKALAERPFLPLCLTLYLNNECNLHCAYCFSMPQPHTAPRLEREAIRAGAEIVARNCEEQGRALTVVFHGGGEPTLHQNELETALSTVEQIAATHGIPIFRYLATNGVMPEQRARWIGAHVDLIGISCDGTPEIQGAQRPLRGGASSAPYLERTAQIIREAGKPLHVRVTLTPGTFLSQAEIAAYVCRVLRPSEIHVEPVYGVGRGAHMEESWHPEDADRFVAAFEEGRAVAARYGIVWRTSGVRMGEIHGTYCHIFRDVLNLIPGGAATACFCTSDADTVTTRHTAIGHWQPGTPFPLDLNHIRHMQQVVSSPQGACERCFNRFHCTRGCPEVCPWDGAMQAVETTFRCQLSRGLTNAHLAAEIAALQNNSDYHLLGIAAKEIQTL
ncbi:hypothetical protein ANRL4_01367 [Anaerolineae bacterium]|nr:hypothetical protein ANRL4_01367 [Anaerolineae bacterium]